MIGHRVTCVIGEIRLSFRARARIQTALESRDLAFALNANAAALDPDILDIYHSVTPPLPLSCGKHRTYEVVSVYIMDSEGVKSLLCITKDLSCLFPETIHRTKTRKAVARWIATAYRCDDNLFLKKCQLNCYIISIR